MTRSPWLRACIAAVTLLGTGCTTLREIPRGQFTSKGQRENVRVVTQDGLVYDFEWIEIREDTLHGYKRRDVEGRFDEIASLAVPVAEVAQMSRRTVDWYRTTLIGGGVVAAALLAGVGSRAEEPAPGTSSGGGAGRPPQ
jgi:hypothetical protein